MSTDNIAAVNNTNSLGTPMVKLTAMWAATSYGQIEKVVSAGASIPASAPIVWDGIIHGIKIADWLLLATLIYTVTQAGILIWEKIVVPIWNRKRTRVVSFRKTTPMKRKPPINTKQPRN